MEQGGVSNSERSNDDELPTSVSPPPPPPSLFPIAPSVSVAATGAGASKNGSLAFPSLAAAASSLFPVSGNADLQQHGDARPGLDWLSNPTFSEALLTVSSALGPPNQESAAAVDASVSSAATTVAIPTLGEREHISDDPRKSSPGRLRDSGSGSSSDHRKSSEKSAIRKRRHERHSGKSRKRRQQISARDFDGRKGSVLQDVVPFGPKSSGSRVVTTGSSRDKRDYYFDTHGDQDSMVYGSLYRLDVAKYFRDEINGGVLDDEAGFGFLDSLANLQGVLQDEGVKSKARYWSLKFFGVERKRKLKKLRVCRSNTAQGNQRNVPGSPLALEAGCHFMPLEIESNLREEASDSVGGTYDGETWGEYVVEKTRDLNKLTRDRPNDVGAWLQFTDFQDELIHSTNNKAAVQNLVAKKIAILERALNSIPDSEDLLVLYLETCKRIDEVGLLLGKWERAVQRHSGSLRMWQEYLQFRRTHFSTFSVSSIRNLYNDALRGLAAARNRVYNRSDVDDSSEELVQAEEALVCIFVDLCRFNWQASHHEVAVGLFQAEIEYSLLGPQMRESDSSRLQKFEEFWRSGSLRVGESGALGWAEFRTGDDQSAGDTESQAIEEDVGGWTGWFEPSASGKDQGSDEEENWNVEEDVALDNGTLEEDLDAALLEKLGLALDSSKEVEVDDVGVWKRWSDKEDERDEEQWLPLRPDPNDADEQLERTVLYDDIKESLFTIHSRQAQLSLLYELVDFFDGTSPQCRCSNSDAYISKLKSLVNLTATGTESMFDNKWTDQNMGSALVELVRIPPWHEVSTDRAKFLRNCLNLVKHVSLKDRFLLDAMLKAEAGPRGADRASARALAKKLLKVNRKDLQLWRAYGCLEAAAGSLTTTRNVFDTILSSLGSPGTESQGDSPVLYLTYAELELAQAAINPNGNSERRALYILSFLGSGSEFVPQSSGDAVPKIQLLKAQRGFGEHLRRLRAVERGNLTFGGAALVACAALFEQLMNGWEAAAGVFEAGLALGLPQKRRQSLEFELLFLRYVQMLEKATMGAMPARSQPVLLRGLHQYPRNSKLLNAYVNVASLISSRCSLRRFFDKAFATYTSSTTQLSALFSEICSCVGSPRIHRLFERALDSKELRDSVLLWRCYLAYEAEVASDPGAARRVYFRAIHACPWSKALWLDGFRMLSSKMSAKELSEFVDMMRDKELHLRTDVYEILLEDAG